MIDGRVSKGSKRNHAGGMRELECTIELKAKKVSDVSMKKEPLDEDGSQNKIGKRHICQYCGKQFERQVEVELRLTQAELSILLN